MSCASIRAPANTSAVPRPEIDILQRRADLFRQIRSFFCARDVTEVEVPLVYPATVTDLHIESIPVLLERAGKMHEHYLITSPEFFMKRLLAEGSPAIFYLGKVFRQGEHGSRHHHEFTMIEWYRPQWDECQLMQEVQELLTLFFPGKSTRRVAYGDLFEAQLGINPHTATVDNLRTCVTKHVDINAATLSANDCLDLLFSHVIEPGLTDIVFVHDYPQAQAALAQLGHDARGQTVARRFEVFLDGMELANGYGELTDAVEQRRRFAQDLDQRRQSGKRAYPLDEKLLCALDNGLPRCAGVALGVDRLLMKVLGKNTMAEVVFTA